MAQWPRATLLLSETMDNPISAGSQVASVLSPLHHFCDSVFDTYARISFESLHQGRGLESHLPHPIATSLTYEGQLVVLGQAVTRGSTPKATLLEPTLFRRFFTSSLLTESYGESVASGVWVNG